MSHTHDPHGAATDQLPGPGYETRDASARGLIIFGIGLIIALVVVQLVMYFGFYRLFISERPRPVPEPAQTNIYQQLRDLHSRENKVLSSYGWVDPKSGVARIPIDRAIELVAEKGIPFGKGPKSEIEMNSHAGTPASLAPSATPGAEKDEKKPPEGTEKGTGTKP